MFYPGYGGPPNWAESTWDPKAQQQPPRTEFSWPADSGYCSEGASKAAGLAGYLPRRNTATAYRQVHFPRHELQKVTPDTYAQGPMAHQALPTRSNQYPSLPLGYPAVPSQRPWQRGGNLPAAPAAGSGAGEFEASSVVDEEDEDDTAASVSSDGPSSSDSEGLHGDDWRQAPQTSVDPAHPVDLTVHLELPISDDIESELEAFCRLRRLGEFKAAKEFFESSLSEHMTNAYVLIQYAEMLLEMGDYKSFETLDPTPVLRLASLESGQVQVPFLRDLSVQDTDSSETLVDSGLLQLHWRLLNTLRLIYTQDSAVGAAEEIKKVLQMLNAGANNGGLGSTELRIVTLSLRILDHIRLGDPTIDRGVLEKSVSQWLDWGQLCRNLLAEQRLWEFSDLAMAAMRILGREALVHKIRDVQDDDESDFMKGLSPAAIKDDEGLSLAALEFAVSVILESHTTTGLERDRLDARGLAESIATRHPESMRSRAYIRWLLVEAVFSRPKAQSGLPASYNELKQNLEEAQGITMTSSKRLIDLPIYVPRGLEVPSWDVTEATAAAMEPVRLALGLSKDMQDYRTTALCFKLLALRTREPGPLLRQLSRLQADVQGDRKGNLRTCLTRYIGCDGNESMKQLLAELNELQSDEVDVRLEKRHPGVYWALDFIKRALKGRIQRRKDIPVPSLMSYYHYLPEKPRQFLDEARGYTLYTPPPRSPKMQVRASASARATAGRSNKHRKPPAPRESQPSKSSEPAMREQPRITGRTGISRASPSRQESSQQQGAQTDRPIAQQTQSSSKLCTNQRSSASPRRTAAPASSGFESQYPDVSQAAQTNSGKTARDTENVELKKPQRSRAERVPRPPLREDVAIQHRPGMSSGVSDDDNDSASDFSRGSERAVEVKEDSISSSGECSGIDGEDVAHVDDESGSDSPWETTDDGDTASEITGIGIGETSRRTSDENGRLKESSTSSEGSTNVTAHARDPITGSFGSRGKRSLGSGGGIEEPLPGNHGSAVGREETSNGNSRHSSEAEDRGRRTKNVGDNHGAQRPPDRLPSVASSTPFTVEEVSSTAEGQYIYPPISITSPQSSRVASTQRTEELHYYQFRRAASSRSSDRDARGDQLADDYYNAEGEDEEEFFDALSTQADEELAPQESMSWQEGYYHDWLARRASKEQEIAARQGVGHPQRAGERSPFAGDENDPKPLFPGPSTATDEKRDSRHEPLRSRLSGVRVPDSTGIWDAFEEIKSKKGARRPTQRSAKPTLPHNGPALATRGSQLSNVEDPQSQRRSVRLGKEPVPRVRTSRLRSRLGDTTESRTDTDSDGAARRVHEVHQARLKRGRKKNRDENRSPAEGSASRLAHRDKQQQRTDSNVGARAIVSDSEGPSTDARRRGYAAAATENGPGWRESRTEPEAALDCHGEPSQRPFRDSSTGLGPSQQGTISLSNAPKPPTKDALGISTPPLPAAASSRSPRLGAARKAGHRVRGTQDKLGTSRKEAETQKDISRAQSRTGVGEGSKPAQTSPLLGVGGGPSGMTSKDVTAGERIAEQEETQTISWEKTRASVELGREGECKTETRAAIRKQNERISNRMRR